MSSVGISQTIRNGLRTTTMILFRCCLILGIMAAAGTAIYSSASPVVFSVNMSGKEIEKLRGQVTPIMELTDQELMNWVPVRSGGLFFVDCPNCNSGTQDRGRFQWDYRNPMQIRCQGCGEVYPTNKKYPENGDTQIKTGSGVTHIDFHRSKKRSKPYYFSSHVDYWRRLYLEESARNLARLYRATGEEAYARKAAIILIRFAEVYPDWVLKFDFPFREVEFKADDGKPIPGIALTRTSKRSWWGILESEPLSLIEAYDLLQGWEGWQQTSRSDSEKIVRENLLHGMMTFALDREDWSTSTHQPRVGKLVIARVLQNPEYVHRSLRRFMDLGKRFSHDGQYHNTSPSYMQQMSGTFASWIRYAEGYRDPEGYLDINDGEHWQDLQLSNYWFIQKTLEALNQLRLPNGILIPVNDTWANKGGKPLTAQETAKSLMYPGMGIAVLGGGKGQEAWKLYLNFTAGRIHKHNDALALGLYADGVEWISDIGYTHTRLRPWTTTTMAHSTVTVNGRNSETDGWEQVGGHYPLLFVAHKPEFQVMSAESRVAYSETERYRRTIYAHAQKEDLLYFIDRFEVTGAAQADYVLLGPLVNEASVEPEGFEVSSFNGSLLNKGVTFRHPKGESDDLGNQAGFGFYQQIREGQPGDSAGLFFLSGKKTVTTGVEQRLEVYLKSEPHDAVYLARVPSVRAANEQDKFLEDHDAPAMTWRRMDKSKGETEFVTLMIPPAGQSSIKELVWTEYGAEIHLQDKTKHVWLLNPVRNELVEFDGLVALLRIDQEGKVLSGYQVAGSKLRYTDWVWSQQSVAVGEGVCVDWQIANSQADSTNRFLLKGSMPELTSGILTLFFADDTRRVYNINKVTPKGEGTFLVEVKEEIGLERKDGRLISVCYPLWEKPDSPIRYQIDGYAEF